MVPLGFSGTMVRPLALEGESMRPHYGVENPVLYEGQGDGPRRILRACKISSPRWRLKGGRQKNDPSSSQAPIWLHDRLRLRSKMTNPVQLGRHRLPTDSWFYRTTHHSKIENITWSSRYFHIPVAGFLYFPEPDEMKTWMGIPNLERISESFCRKSNGLSLPLAIPAWFVMNTILYPSSTNCFSLPGIWLKSNFQSWQLVGKTLPDWVVMMVPSKSKAAILIYANH